jgi:UDP-N-acetylmuramyl pentapeptide phosphotransferase/UDP-N-acetylglucosamine-1-phosphate transferase
VSRRVVAGLLSAAGTALALAQLQRRPPGGPARWSRRNHRGEPVTLLEGPAYVGGALGAVGLASGTGPRLRAAALLATTGAAALGAYDDLGGDGTRRGLRGHLTALAHGELSTGAVKVLGLAAGGLGAAVLLHPGGQPGSRGRAARLVDVASSGALIAGTANLVNLLDLRPGRALKVVAALGLLTAAGGADPAILAAAATGSSLAALPADLAERAMLGDTGANAAGALLGVAWAARLHRPGRLLALAAVTALTLASERVSFTAVIERTPALAALDRLGRRAPEPVPAPVPDRT